MRVKDNFFPSLCFLGIAISGFPLVGNFSEMKLMTIYCSPNGRKGETRLEKDRRLRRLERTGAGRDGVFPHGELGNFQSLYNSAEAPIPVRVGLCGL